MNPNYINKYIYKWGNKHSKLQSAAPWVRNKLLMKVFNEIKKIENSDLQVKKMYQTFYLLHVSSLEVTTLPFSYTFITGLPLAATISMLVLLPATGSKWD